MFGLGSTARFALETLESLPIMFGLGPDAVSFYLCWEMYSDL
jgi:hypothetical protein